MSKTRELQNSRRISAKNTEFWLQNSSYRKSRANSSSDLCSKKPGVNAVLSSFLLLWSTRPSAHFSCFLAFKLVVTPRTTTLAEKCQCRCNSSKTRCPLPKRGMKLTRRKQGNPMRSYVSWEL